MSPELWQHMGVYGALEAVKFYMNSKPAQELISVIDCYGRVLAEDVVSAVDLPPSSSSKVAGFAIRARDAFAASASNHLELAIQREDKPLSRGQRSDAVPAYQIEVGETLPRETDTVLLPGEVSSTQSISRPPSTGEHVDAAGAEVKKGETILRKGTVLRAQEVALLTLIRSQKVSVFVTPKVAILPMVRGSGGESAPVLEATSGAIGLLVAAAGATSFIHEGVPDDPTRLSSALKSALAEADIVITISDPSEAGPDPVETAVSSFGKPGIVVRAVRMEPGGTTGFGMAQSKPVMIIPRSMPGALASFMVFIYPLIRNLLGQTFAEPPSVLATLSAEWQVEERFLNFANLLYVSIWTGPDGLVAQPLEAPAGRATLPSAANGYVLVPESLGTLKKGAKVWAHLCPGFSYLDARFL